MGCSSDAVCGSILFPFGGFTVEVGDVHQFHLADVMVAAQGVHQHAGGIDVFTKDVFYATLGIENP